MVSQRVHGIARDPIQIGFLQSSNEVDQEYLPRKSWKRLVSSLCASPTAYLISNQTVVPQWHVRTANVLSEQSIERPREREGTDRDDDDENFNKTPLRRRKQGVRESAQESTEKAWSPP